MHGSPTPSTSIWAPRSLRCQRRGGANRLYIRAWPLPPLLLVFSPSPSPRSFVFSDVRSPVSSLSVSGALPVLSHPISHTRGEREQSMSMVYRVPNDIVSWTVLRPTSLEGANQLQVLQDSFSSHAPAYSFASCCANANHRHHYSCVFKDEARRFPGARAACRPVHVHPNSQAYKTKSETRSGKR